MKKAVTYNVASGKHRKYTIHTEVAKSENSKEKVSTSRKASSKTV